MLLSDLFEGDDKLATETIRKVKGGYRLVSHNGKNLGTYPTHAGAEKREKQVNYFKHVGETKVTLYTDPEYYGADVESDDDDTLPVHEIPLNKLVGFEPDSKMDNPKHNANMMKMVKLIQAGNGSKLPPILVRKYKGGYQVLDGHHRFHAYKKAGMKSIPSKIVPDENIKVVDKVTEGPIWNKVRDTAIAGTMAGALGYGALTGQLRDKPQPPPIDKPPLEITIPGGDIAPTKKAEPQKQEKLQPSTATNANKEMESIVLTSAKKAGIQGQELAQFMGQVAHETLGFQHLVEIGNKEYFNKYEPEHNPKKAAILGNVKAGDGMRYKGRGFIHITGRDNYRRAGKALGLDLENNPKLASNPKVAAAIAVWYWKNRVRTEVKDFSDTIGVTAKVNPSMNGLGDRDMNFHHYLQKLNQ
jgi:predicted chitinase